MKNTQRLFARAAFLLLAVLLTACQVTAAPIPAPVLRIVTLTPEGAALPAAPSPAPTQTALPATAAPTPSATALPAAVPTAAVAVTTITAGRVVVPILMYHRIRDDGATRYITTVKAFREQMQVLKDGGYHTLTIEQLAQAIRQGGSIPANPVVLTFDDGFLDVYENAFPIMKDMGFTGVAYIIAITFEKERAYGYMQPEQLKALAAAGWEIGSHSVTHTDLQSSKLGIGNEIQKSKDTLEAEVGVKVHSFDYPFGASTPWIEDLVKQSGYDAAVGLGTTITHTTKGLYYLSRREVYRGISLDDFRALLQPGEADQYVGAPLVTPGP